MRAGRHQDERRPVARLRVDLRFVALRGDDREAGLAAFLAEAERAVDGAFPALRTRDFGAVFRPEPSLRPPPVVLLTVAQARASASSSPTPRFS